MNSQYEEVKKESEKMVVPESLEVIRTAKIVEDNILKEEPNNKIPETVFKEYFLDFFRNYNKPTEPTDSDNTLYAKWLELAGSEYREVDVVNDKGETVFSTPPLLTVPNINFEATRAIGVNDIAVNATQNFNRTPAESANFVTDKVSKMFSGGAISVDTRTDTARWEDILKRYSKIPTEEEEKENMKKAIKKMPTVIKEDLGLIYD